MDIKFHTSTGPSELVTSVTGISGSQADWLRNRIREDVQDLNEQNMESAAIGLTNEAVPSDYVAVPNNQCLIQAETNAELLRQILDKLNGVKSDHVLVSDHLLAEIIDKVDNMHEPIDARYRSLIDKVDSISERIGSRRYSVPEVVEDDPLTGYRLPKVVAALERKFESGLPQAGVYIRWHDEREPTEIQVKVRWEAGGSQFWLKPDGIPIHEVAQKIYDKVEQLRNLIVGK